MKRNELLSLKKGAIVLLQFAVTVGLLRFIFNKYDVFGEIRQLNGVGWVTVCAVVVLYVAQIWVVTFRLLLVLRQIGGGGTFLGICRSTLIGTFFTQTPLSMIGGDVSKLWVIARDGTPLRVAASAVAIDRVLGLLSLVGLICLTMVPLWLTVVDPGLRVGIVFSIALIMAGTVFLLLLQKMPARLQALPVIGWFAVMSREFHSLLRVPGSLAAFILLGMIAHVLSLSIMYVIAADLHVPVSFWNILVLAPFALLVSLLPLSIGGWGVREGTMVIAFGLIGIPQGQTLSISILFGLSLLLLSLPGALVWLATIAGGRGEDA